jgi:hypothetical protein
VILCPRLQQSCGITFAPCAGTRTLGEPVEPPFGRPPNTRSPVVDCRSKTTPAAHARAVCWTGHNRADVEALTGRCVADSLCTEGAVLVDAWGTPQPCHQGHWVIVAGDTVVVLPAAAFFAGYRVVSRRVAKEAA